MRWLDAVGRLIAGPEGSAAWIDIANGGNSGPRELWLAWTEMPYPRDYPPGSHSGVVDGVDLALCDGDLAYLFQAYFRGDMTESEREQLAGAVRTLERVVPHLRGDGRPYFATALAVARWIARGSPAA